MLKLLYFLIVTDEEQVEAHLTNSDEEEDEGVVNPYPVLIMPKFGQNQKTNKPKGIGKSV